MSIAADTRTRMITQLDEWQRQAQGNGFFQRVRLAARERLEVIEFPTIKNEDWKYTNLSPFFKEAFQFPGKSPLAKNFDLADKPVFENGYRLVFVNGQYLASLSDIPEAPEKVLILPLTDAVLNHQTQVENILATVSGKVADIFSDLATACLREGVFINIPRDMKPDKPIHIFFYSSQSETPFFAPVRILIHSESGSEATVVEHYMGEDAAIYHANPVTQILMDANARLSHYQLGFESNHAFHISRMAVHQRRDSQFSGWNVNFGGRLVRNDIYIKLAESGSRVELNGLSIAQGEQHIDNQIFIDHAAPRTSSRENYRGIVDDKGHAVFTGRVLIRQDSQKSDAQQVNKSLLLSESAQVDTRPQLEIFADDVKASHGATVGQLDDDQIFYLRTRGIGESDARQMLTHAFANEIVNAIPDEALRNFLDDAVQQRLGEQKSGKDAE